MEKIRLSLQVVVVGAGLAGLAVALSLARAGHAVQVLERKEGISEFGAGIVIPPNSSRILHAWGLTDRFQEKSDRLGEIFFKKSTNGEVLLKIATADYASGYP